MLKDVSPNRGCLVGAHLLRLAVVVACLAIVASAFHFWPFESSKKWQVFCPSNSTVLVWIAIVSVCAIWVRNRKLITGNLPHVSVLAYLAIGVFSASFSNDPVRSFKFISKLVLMFAGGYLLFNMAASDTKSMRWMYWSLGLASVLAVGECLIIRFGVDVERFGFHTNVNKYGTYIGLTVPLSATYWLLHDKPYVKLVGSGLIMTTLLSAGSIGPIIGIGVAMIGTIVCLSDKPRKIWILISLLCGIIVLVSLNRHKVAQSLRKDLKLVEDDKINLKQRYIEWQAAVNLLELRTVTGTSAGCFNSYRSNFYYRLPKLNTLKPFDQNGWLTSGAEMGVFGLVCFVWIILHYGAKAFKEVRALRSIPNSSSQFAPVLANFAGLSSACIVNLFSSVYYNGILIVFVLLLVLISNVNKRIIGINSNG